MLPDHSANPEQAWAAAVAHHAAGRVRAAAEGYKAIVRADPNHAPALHHLGVIAHAAGHHGEAVRLIGRAVALQPDLAEAHVNLGSALHATGRYDAAADSCRRALSLRPWFPQAHNNLGNALAAGGRLDAAIDSYRRAIADDPGYAVAAANLARALQQAGRPDESNGVDPFAADVEQGEAAMAAGRPSAAADAYGRAAALRPDLPEVWYNLSVALNDAGDLDAAATAAHRSLALRPAYPAALNNLAGVLKAQGRVGDAIDCYRRAVAGAPGEPRVHGNLVYAMSFDPTSTAADVLHEARQWEAAHGRAGGVAGPVARDRSPDRRLRVGYVSPDFRDHVVGRNVFPLVQAHDRAAVEVFCYSNVTRADAITEAFRSATDVWRDVSTLSDDAAAEQVRRDEIDVLVDLTLHMADGRLGVFARRPAPVQVTFGGYPGTTGLSAIDGRLTDPYLDPPGTDADYAERSVRLPDSFWCYDPAAMGVGAEPEPGPPPAVGNGFVTFGCLNNFCKVNADVLDAWGRVMAAVPASRLVLLAPRGSARAGVLAALAGHGVGDGRVEFVPFQSRADYLATYRRIDVGLDTFPYNGHTTSLDGFWTGVPTVTRVGRTAVGRAGWSQLSNLGLTDLAAADVDGFVATAARLATDLPRLAAVRSGLRGRMRASPLTDVGRFTQDVEAAYRRMWNAPATAAGPGRTGTMEHAP